MRTLELTGVLGIIDVIETLEILKFANNGVRNLNVLTTLPAQRKIDLSGNEVIDLNPQVGVIALERIAIFGNSVDLTEGSNQLELLKGIIEHNGATVSLTVAPVRIRLSCRGSSIPAFATHP